MMRCRMALASGVPPHLFGEGTGHGGYVYGVAKVPPTIFSSGRLGCPSDVEDAQVQLVAPVTTCQRGWAYSPTANAMVQ